MIFPVFRLRALKVMSHVSKCDILATVCLAEARLRLSRGKGKMRKRISRDSNGRTIGLVQFISL